MKRRTADSRSRGGSGVGFPPTRFLVLDGASHGRKFKAWARHSMAVSRFWFSAYRDLTVDQIERNARIADGLRKATLESTGGDRMGVDLRTASPVKERLSWRLKPPHDQQTQGIVVSEFLPTAGGQGRCSSTATDWRNRCRLGAVPGCRHRIRGGAHHRQ